MDHKNVQTGSSNSGPHNKECIGHDPLIIIPFQVFGLALFMGASQARERTLVSIPPYIFRQLQLPLTAVLPPSISLFFSSIPSSGRPSLVILFRSSKSGKLIWEIYLYSIPKNGFGQGVFLSLKPVRLLRNFWSGSSPDWVFAYGLLVFGTPFVFNDMFLIRWVTYWCGFLWSLFCRCGVFWNWVFGIGLWILVTIWRDVLMIFFIGFLILGILD